MPDKDSALVLIDLQDTFLNAQTCHIIPVINRLIGSGKFEHIIASKFVNRPESQFVKLDIFTGCLNEKESGLTGEIDFAGAVVIERCLFTCVTDDFLKYAKNNGIHNFYITGLDTDACVIKTAMDLLELGFVPYILADCCASSGGDKYHHKALHLLERNIGKKQITNSEMLL